MHLACPPRAWISSAAGEYASGIIEVPMKGLLGHATRRAEMKIHKYIIEHAIDVVHTHMKWDSLAAIPAARKAGVPLVCTVHGLNEQPYFAEADAVVGISKAVVDYIISHGVDTRRVALVYNAHKIPDDIPPRSAIREELGITDDTQVVVMVARLMRRKGCDILLDAAALLPNAHFWVAGYGKPKYERWLRGRARKLRVNGRVTFLGLREDSLKVMAGADVVVVPSRQEAFGRVALEAMIAGLPVVASDVDGLPEVVEDGVTGILFPSEDGCALAEAIRRLLADPALRLKMGRAGRKRVEERFTIERMCEDLLRVYSSLL